jgi:uncharacterized membrane protein
MTVDKAFNESTAMNRILGKQLKYGTWLASTVIALGIVVTIFRWRMLPHGNASTFGLTIIGMGIALIILLPILRVALMVFMFLHERNYLFAMISCIVLLIIGLSVVVGLYLPPPNKNSSLSKLRCHDWSFMRNVQQNLRGPKSSLLSPCMDRISMMHTLIRQG